MKSKETVTVKEAVRSDGTTASKKEKWKQLNGRQKVQYIWDYYKFPIVVGLIFLYIIGYIIYGHLSKKDTVLYTALINVSASEELKTQLDDGFIGFTDADASKNEAQLYAGLYLTTDQDDPNHEYTYASRIKILASIDNEQLDVVLMNKKAFDAFSQNGYLCNLEKLFRNSYPEVFAEVQPYLVTNTEILEDNSEELILDDSLSYEAVTKEYPMGLDASQKGIFKQAGFEDTVYLGIIKNSPRTKMAIAYIKYLFNY